MVKFSKKFSHTFIKQKLITNQSPIRNRALIPLAMKFSNTQIKDFEYGIVRRKSPTFRDFMKSRIYSINRIGGVHNFEYRRRKVKKLLNVRKIAFPDSHCSGIFIPDLAKTFKLNLSSLKARCAVNLFQVGAKILVIFSRHVL